MVYFGGKVLIEQEDAKLISDGDTVTFINWGNLKVAKVEKNADESVKQIDAVLDLENKVN